MSQNKPKGDQKLARTTQNEPKRDLKQVKTTKIKPKQPKTDQKEA